MSVLAECKTVDITEFTGANLIADEEDITEPQALYNRNTEFVEGQVRTRRGFGQAFSPAAIVRQMYNWVQQNFNRLMYLRDIPPATLISRDITGGTENTVLSNINAFGMSIAQAGYRIFTTFFDLFGVGVQQPIVWDGTFSSGVANADPVFPVAYDVSTLSGGASWGSFSNTGSGVVTFGTHSFALVFGTWNGAQVVGPLNAGVFAPRTFAATGGAQVQLVVTPATVWPHTLYSIQVAMTTVNNPDRWFLVPSTNGGGPQVVSRDSNIAVTFNINIDDVTLTGGGPTEITNTLFNLFSGSAFAHCLLAYNNRMCYLLRQVGTMAGSFIATLFISDPYAPQYVIPALNSLNLPELRDATTMAATGATLYVFGPAWTYAFSDNGNTPVNWSPPRVVSGDIGSPFIHGVTQNPSKGRIWVCDHSGLYCFNGAVYTEVPASYWQKSDWDRINFKAYSHALTVKEYPEFRLVVVKAPLDGSFEATHLMVWDYTNGFTPDKLKYCGLWNLADYPNLGDIEIVINPAVGNVKELWASRGDQGGDVRRMKSVKAGDATDKNPINLYDDSGNGIDSAYKLLAVSRAAEGPQMQVGGRFRIRGVGPININAYSFDQQRSTTLTPIDSSELSNSINANNVVSGLQPGQRFDRLLDEQSEAVSYQIDNGATAGSFFYFAAVRLFYLPWMAERE